MSPLHDVAVASLQTPVGLLSVAVTEIGLLGVSWGEPRSPSAERREDEDAWTGPVLDQLAEYFRGERTDFELPLDWSRTSGSQQSVLRALHEGVPYGKSITYGELAARSGTGVPARGIGSIMGSNPLPIVVPCHRVLAHNGLGGYSGGSGTDGLAVKRWLLTLEGALPPTLDWDPERMVL